MVDPLVASLKISGSGLHAQSQRMRVVSENLANVQSTGKTEGSDPYQRKTITFQSEMDRALGAELVEIDGIGKDDSAFRIEYDPSHPAADKDGNVKYPNVNTLIELADMREATRSYEAGLSLMKQSREMITRTIDLLRSR
ncbi:MULTISPECIES: flagellar basal body rod protein FlgC [Pseudovibrio]|uniref:flagellar basal body rod protein FlgC n=1 Tax=Stappiaceae TaxID=2821832 RepID=UPI002366C5F3|nr:MULTISPECIES: flagellar basal body rod protein FlgC [Pseudovibrio]MDD7909019.1 flagellar basal body rod protein FlgC [Pseudovibrio exalbescens]MDX5593660.1 flagellar basal body rod protein FlgC [Pseudovibrio sp. SPO723]